MRANNYSLEITHSTTTTISSDPSNSRDSVVALRVGSVRAVLSLMVTVMEVVVVAVAVTAASLNS